MRVFFAGVHSLVIGVVWRIGYFLRYAFFIISTALLNPIQNHTLSCEVSSGQRSKQFDFMALSSAMDTSVGILGFDIGFKYNRSYVSTIGALVFGSISIVT